jgi:hypothetical protein
MEEMKSIEERVADLEDYVERLALAMGKIAKGVEIERQRVEQALNPFVGFNPVENTK